MSLYQSVLERVQSFSMFDLQNSRCLRWNLRSVRLLLSSVLNVTHLTRDGSPGFQEIVHGFQSYGNFLCSGNSYPEVPTISIHLLCI